MRPSQRRSIIPAFIPAFILILLTLAACQTIAVAEVTTTPDCEAHYGDGSTVAFTFSFGVYETDEVLVRVETEATGALAVLTENSDYTIALPNGDGWLSPGGTVTLDDTYSTAYTVWLSRVPAMAQESDWDTADALDLDDLEDDFDRSAIRDRYLWRMLQRTLRASDTETVDMNLPSAVARASTQLTFGTSGEPLCTAGVVSPDDVTTSAFWKTILDDADLAASLITLGLRTQAGNVAFKSAANLDHVVDINDYGATGDGATDDTAAIVAAFAAVPAGGTVYIPIGQHRFTSALTMTDAKPFNIIGEGEGSCLAPDLGPTVDALTIGDGSAYLQEIRLQGFSILGANDACKNGLVMNRVVHSDVIDLTICAGAAERSARLYGCVNCDFDIRTSGTGTGYTYSRDTGGVYCARYPAADYFNLNRVRITASIHETDCFNAREYESLDLSGVFENADSDNSDDDGEPEIYIYGGSGLHAHDIYTESIYGDTRGKIVLYSVSNANLESVFGNGGTCILTGFCNNVTLGPGSWWYNLSIGLDCVGTSIGPGVYLGSRSGGFGVTDLGKATSWIAPIFWAPNGKTDPNEFPMSVPFGATDSANLLTNSNFARWGASAPSEWAASIGGTGTTLSQAGTGLSDTTTHYGANTLKWVQTGSGGYIYYTLNATQLARVVGQTITGAMWIDQNAGTPTANTPAIYLAAYGSAQGTKTGASSMVTVDVDARGWQRHFCTLSVPSDATQVNLVLSGGGTSVVTYAAQPFLGVGLVGQRGWIATRNEFERVITKTTTITATGPHDDVDVAGVGVVFVDASSNVVTISGFTGGVQGQSLHIVVTDATNDVTLEHAEGSSVQDIYLLTAADEPLSVAGGWSLICDGSDWFAVGN